MEESITQEIRAKLRQVFDYDQFREEQETIIKNVLDGKNTFVIMPTGGGKSLCYQMPALMQPGIAIVISPLIALMKNQVDQLLARGVQAAFLNSTLSKTAVNKLKNDVLAGAMKLLYVAPESLIKAENLAFLKQAPISFIAVDEAHCISDWGHDFRPEYRKIKTVLDQELGVLPMIALTATATPKVQQDILKNLAIEDATLFHSSFNRPNLYYEIRPKAQVEKQLIKFIKDQPNASGIVYCQSRKKVEELATLLNLNGIQAAPYHAGLEPKMRMQNQDAFLNQEVAVIVATIAFGMGIDKPDVRFVIHHDVPRSLEGYYQETGRAGRDGQSSTCLLFYSPEDLTRLEQFNKNKPAAEREKAQALLQAMASYVVTGVCRRKQLLHYFGEAYETDCQYCDNCKNPTETYPGEEFIKLVITAVQQTQERFGINHIIRVLRGIEDSYVKSYRHQTLTSFGQGSEQDKAFWQSVIRQTLLLGLLHKDMAQDNALKITAQGKQFLAKSYPINLHQDNYYTASVDDQQPVAASQEGVHDPALLELLKKIRTQVAQEKGIPIYAVLQDTSLEEMALVYPTSLEALAQISGLSLGKAQKFGAPFVKCIQQYVADHDIVPVSEIVVKSAASRSKNKVYIIQQVDRKIDLEEIAAAKSLSMEALLKEMEQLCYAGTKLTIDYYINTLLTKDQQEEVYDYFMQAETDNIQRAMTALEEAYEEEELRLMRIKFLSEVAN
ncbi:MAG: DNA helicase RecQ [Bacteroidota bacterium]